MIKNNQKVVTKQENDENHKKDVLKHAEDKNKQDKTKTTLKDKKQGKLLRKEILKLDKTKAIVIAEKKSNAIKKGKNNQVKNNKIEIIEKKSKVTKNKKSNKIKIIIASIIIFLIIGASAIGYIIWQSNIVYDVNFANMSGITFGGYTNLSVKNGEDFKFSINIDADIVVYPELQAVTANGVEINEIDGIYTVKNIKADTTIIASGYGTANLTIDDAILHTGVNISHVIIPYGVTKIFQTSFSSYTNITEVFIPDSVEEIGYTAFNNCVNLENITFSQNLKEIGVNAFYSTKWYNNQPDGLIYISRVAYSYKGDMQEGSILNLIDGTYSIADNAFMNKSNLVGINLPSSIKIIGDYAFYGCFDLININISDNLISIGKFAFIDTAWYSEQPDGLLYLKNWLYSYKGALSTSSLALKEGTIGIAGAAFYNFYDLESIYLPDSIKYICDSAFYSCQISIIELPSSLTTIEQFAFASCAITTITIPNKVKEIESFAFVQCEHLISVTFNNNIDIFYDYTFALCSNLESVTFLGKVDTIQSNAFLNCTKLNTIILNTKTPPKIAGQNFLSDASSNLNIFVPSSSLAIYKSIEGWSALCDKIFAQQTE